MTTVEAIQSSTDAIARERLDAALASALASPDLVRWIVSAVTTGATADDVVAVAKALDWPALGRVLVSDLCQSTLDRQRAKAPLSVETSLALCLGSCSTMDLAKVIAAGEWTRLADGLLADPADVGRARAVGDVARLGLWCATEAGREAKGDGVGEVAGHEAIALPDTAAVRAYEVRRGLQAGGIQLFPEDLLLTRVIAAVPRIHVAPVISLDGMVAMPTSAPGACRITIGILNNESLRYDMPMGESRTHGGRQYSLAAVIERTPEPNLTQVIANRLLRSIGSGYTLDLFCGILSMVSADILDRTAPGKTEKWSAAHERKTRITWEGLSRTIRWDRSASSTQRVRRDLMAMIDFLGAHRVMVDSPDGREVFGNNTPIIEYTADYMLKGDGKPVNGVSVRRPGARSRRIFNSARISLGPILSEAIFRRVEMKPSLVDVDHIFSGGGYQINGHGTMRLVKRRMLYQLLALAIDSRTRACAAAGTDRIELDDETIAVDVGLVRIKVGVSDKEKSRLKMKYERSMNEMLGRMATNGHIRDFNLTPSGLVVRPSDRMLGKNRFLIAAERAEQMEKLGLRSMPGRRSIA